MGKAFSEITLYQQQALAFYYDEFLEIRPPHRPSENSTIYNNN